MKVRIDAWVIDKAAHPVDISDGVDLCESVAITRGVLTRIESSLSSWKPWTKIPVSIAIAVCTAILERRCTG